MPQNFLPFTEEDDGRRKILKSQYPAIREFYKKVCSQRKTAEEFGVSKRLIQFILHPHKLEEMQKRNAENQHWKTYYNRKQLTEAVRKLRKKKRELGYLSKGKTNYN